MKVIKDSFMDWLDTEIGKPLPPMLGGRSINLIHEAKIRRATLEEVKTKLIEVITEEFAKLENKDA